MKYCLDSSFNITQEAYVVCRLLDILAARKDPYGLTGEVLINGHPQPSNFRLMSGYVVQDDVVMGTLSVRENLRFSADLRLPREITKMEREAKVNRVISELSLGGCFICFGGYLLLSSLS